MIFIIILLLHEDPDKWKPGWDKPMSAVKF